MGGHTSSDFTHRVLEPFFQLFTAHSFGSHDHLSQEFFKASEHSNQASLVHISHLTDSREGRALSPSIDDFHKLIFKLLTILFLNNRELAFDRDFCNKLGLGLKLFIWLLKLRP